MRLKPKSTVHNPRALHFKRFTDLESSEGFRVVYRTINFDEELFWVFNKDKMQFEITTENPSKFQKQITISEFAYYRFGDFVFRYVKQEQVIGYIRLWERINLADVTPDGTEVSLLMTFGTVEAGFSQIGGDITFDKATKPVEEIKVFQTTGLTFYDCGVDLNVGEKICTYGGGGGYATDTPFDVESGVAKTLYKNSETINSGPAANHILLFAAVNATEETELSAMISFRTKGLDFLSALFNDIAKYQTNKYYYAGSFDYMIRGSIGSQDTQPIKGNIMHLRSFEIKYFDDSVNLDHDDLLVIDGRLYSVSDLTYDIKRSPKPYTVYFASVNNIK